MNYQKLMAWACAAMTFLACTGCGSTNSETAEVDVPAITASTGTTTTKAITETKTTTQTKSSTDTVTTAKTTKETAATTTAKKAAGTVATAGNGAASNQSNATAAAEQQASVQEAENSSADSGTSGTNASSGSNSSTGNNNTPAATEAAEEVADPIEADDTIYITLNGSSAQTTNGSAVSISGSIITIVQEGKYEVSGTLDNGQIIVDVGTESKVNLHLNGVGITCADSAPIYVLSADTCTVHLDSGSTNYVQDTASNALSACVFSKDDLTIKGDGSLTVIGSKKHGIKSSNDVKIKNGNLTVSAVSTAIYGEDSVQMTGGSVVVSACKDGLKASNIEETAKGFVTIEGGYLDVQNAAGNGIEAITGVTISGGTVNIHSTKNTINCDYQSIADGCLFVY